MILGDILEIYNKMTNFLLSIDLILTIEYPESLKNIFGNCFSIYLEIISEKIFENIIDDIIENKNLWN